jgi:hypothetical protein
MPDDDSQKNAPHLFFQFKPLSKPQTKFFFRLKIYHLATLIQGRIEKGKKLIGAKKQEILQPKRLPLKIKLP